MSNNEKKNSSAANQADADKQVFAELHALAMKRFQDRAIASSASRLAEMPPEMAKKFKAAIGAFGQIGRQLSAQFGIDPQKVDLLSIARLQRAGYLTAAEVTRFSPEAQEAIQKLVMSPESKPPIKPR